MLDILFIVDRHGVQGRAVCEEVLVDDGTFDYISQGDGLAITEHVDVGMEMLKIDKIRLQSLQKLATHMVLKPNQIDRFDLQLM